MRGIVPALVLALVLAAPLAHGAELVSDGRPAMGTLLEITLAGARAAPEELERLFAEVERLERLFSRHDPESALSALNRSAGVGLRPVAPELARILADSVAYGRATRGAFDVTVGPLVQLWETAGRRGALPTEWDRARARGLVGWSGLEVVLPDRAGIASMGASVDLGGLAKGWALDRLAERLRASGRARALLSFGGSSFRALGSAPDGGGWRLLVRDAMDGYTGVVTLRDHALSVSASLGQSTEIDGRRYGHVVDPRTGEPVLRHRTAVVVAPSAAAAEAWSTALVVLEADEGSTLVEGVPGVEALLLEPHLGAKETSGFRAATGFEPLQAPSSTQASRSSGSS